MLTWIVCAGLEGVEPKSHLIVVAEKEAFKVRAMAMPEEEEAPAVAPPARAAPAPAPPPARAPAPAPAPPPAAAPVEVPAPVAEGPAPSATFRQYDTNGDGVLDKAEIVAMMESLGYKTDEAYLENLMAVFATYDEDGSGVIDPAEFDQLYSHLVCHSPLLTHAPAVTREPMTTLRAFHG